MSISGQAAGGQYAGLYFMDGTNSQSSYVAVARRGNIFLGVRFTGLSDGKQMGVDGTTYLHVRVRSARDRVKFMPAIRKTRQFRLSVRRRIMGRRAGSRK